MSEREWTKEMSKIDKQLESLSDEALFPSKPAATSAAKADVAAVRRSTTTFGVFARLALSVLLGAGILFWPYPARCGLWLAAYLAVVTMIVASGAWSAVWTWRHRSGRAHSLSLLLILWGLILASTEVLPRIGYAKPDLKHPATWACQ